LILSDLEEKNNQTLLCIRTKNPNVLNGAPVRVMQLASIPTAVEALSFFQSGIIALHSELVYDSKPCVVIKTIIYSSPFSHSSLFPF